MQVKLLSLSLALMLVSGGAISGQAQNLRVVKTVAADKTRAAWPLASLETTAPLVGTDGLDTPTSQRIPNYLRALASTHANAVGPFAHLFRTMLYGGTVAPEVKAAMGLQIAHIDGSAYLAAHLTRILHATESGRKMLAELTTTHSESGNSTAAHIALRYAADLTRDVHGVSDVEFGQARTAYNDAQMIELTATTCFFNYFARYCQAIGLPLESWAQDAPTALPAGQATDGFLPRVALASDEELKSAVQLSNPSPELKKGLGIGVANSQRAMVRVPDIAAAWWDYGKAVRTQNVLPRETQLQISFAVSVANGCRYCTLHQVAGLRRLNVEPAKLLAMQKDDSVLNAKEKACVLFARKLTRTPSKMNESDYAALQSTLGNDQETTDAVLQTCMFSFMNRFTDGLRCPPKTRRYARITRSMALTPTSNSPSATSRRDINRAIKANHPDVPYERRGD